MTDDFYHLENTDDINNEIMVGKILYQSLLQGFRISLENMFLFLFPLRRLNKL